MISFVDIEHAAGATEPYGERLMAARTRLTYRLEDVVGEPCLLTRYTHLGALLAEVPIRALFLSGNASPPERYDAGELDAFYDILRTAGVPIFGFCGGMQFIASAFGVDVVKLYDDPDGDLSPADRAEFGYLPIEILEPHPLLSGLGESPVFRHAHNLHVPTVPPGFSVHASTGVTPVQMMIHEAHKIAGTQFHPEYWTDEHPAGRTMIENFVTWAGLA